MTATALDLIIPHFEQRFITQKTQFSHSPISFLRVGELVSDKRQLRYGRRLRAHGLVLGEVTE